MLKLAPQACSLWRPPRSCCIHLAGAGQAHVLLQMNERLAFENASLLAELSTFSTGKHPLIRKLAAAATAAAAAAPGASQAIQSGVGVGGGGGGGCGAGFGGPGGAAGGLGGGAGGMGAASGMGAAVGSAGMGVGSTAAVRDALAAAVREVLLCSKQVRLLS